MSRVYWADGGLLSFASNGLARPSSPPTSSDVLGGGTDNTADLSFEASEKTTTTTTTTTITTVP